jgi:hypothetical protein
MSWEYRSTVDHSSILLTNLMAELKLTFEPFLYARIYFFYMYYFISCFCSFSSFLTFVLFFIFYTFPMYTYLLRFFFLLMLYFSNFSFYFSNSSYSLSLYFLRFSMVFFSSEIYLSSLSSSSFLFISSLFLIITLYSWANYPGLIILLSSSDPGNKLFLAFSLWSCNILSTLLLAYTCMKSCFSLSWAFFVWRIASIYFVYSSVWVYIFSSYSIYFCSIYS